MFKFSTFYIKWYNINLNDDFTLMTESEEELKRLLMRVKEENEKPKTYLKTHQDHGI